MSFKDWFKNRLALGEPKNGTVTYNIDMDDLEFTGKRTPSKTEALYSSTYYACMRIRCDALAKLPIKVMQHYEKGGAQKLRTHELWQLLSLRPNPNMTAYDLLWATEFQRLDYGRAFWVIQKNARGKRTNIYLLDSSLVQIWIDNTSPADNQKVYYMYNDPVKGELIYRPDDIACFKNFATDGVYGKGIRQYLADIIQHENDATAVLRDKYESGLQDPIIVQYVGDLNEAMQAKIKKKFNSLGGTKNAGKVVPIPSEFKVSQLETKLVNSQFFELQGLSERQIANAFGVKSFQLNDLSRSTYANIAEQNRAFYSDTMQGTITEYEQEMTWVLLYERERKNGIYIEFNIDAMLRSDPESRMSAYINAVNSSIRTVAEVRELEGLPFIPGTDRLLRDNGAAIWLEDLGKQYGANDTNSSENPDSSTIPDGSTSLTGEGGEENEILEQNQ